MAACSEVMEAFAVDDDMDEGEDLLEDDDDEYGEEHARCHAERPEAVTGER